VSTDADDLLFRALCPACGQVELTAAQLRLVVSERPFYSFRCPRCRRAVRKPAGERIVELLTEGGVLAMRVHAS
jgi:hypothetical protein